MSNKRRDNKNRILRTGESQRKDGKYEYKYIDCDGSRRSLYSWTLVATDSVPLGKKQDFSLREKEDELHRKLQNGVIISNAAKTLNDYIEIAFEIKGYSKSTYENMWHNYSRHIKNGIGKYRISDIKRIDIKRLYLKFKENGYSNGTIHSFHNIISTGFNIAEEDDAIMRNVSKGCCKDYPYEFNRDAMSPKEQDIFFNEILPQYTIPNYTKNEERYRYYLRIFKILLGLSCRINEMLGLTWKDIDLEAKTVHIYKGLLYRHSTAEFFISKGTTKNRNRIIPMTDEVQKYFQELYDLREEKNRNIAVDGYNDFVFVNSRNRLFVLDYLNKFLKRAVKWYNEKNECGFPLITCHIFRHTGCTNMVEKGVEMNTIAYIMGHTTTKMITKIYDTIRLERVQNELKKME